MYSSWALRYRIEMPRNVHATGLSAFTPLADLDGYLGKQTPTSLITDTKTLLRLYGIKTLFLDLQKADALRKKVLNREGCARQTAVCKALTMVAKVCFEQSSLELTIEVRWSSHPHY